MKIVKYFYCTGGDVRIEGFSTDLLDEKCQMSYVYSDEPKRKAICTFLCLIAFIASYKCWQGTYKYFKGSKSTLLTFYLF